MVWFLQSFASVTVYTTQRVSELFTWCFHCVSYDGVIRTLNRVDMTVFGYIVALQPFMKKTSNYNTIINTFHIYVILVAFSREFTCNALFICKDVSQSQQWAFTLRLAADTPLSTNQRAKNDHLYLNNERFDHFTSRHIIQSFQNAFHDCSEMNWNLLSFCYLMQRHRDIFRHQL